MNYRVKKYMDRWESLITEADQRLSSNSADVVWASGWVAQVDNIVNAMFEGDKKQIKKIFVMKNQAILGGKANIGVIGQLNGFLKGTLDDLKGGYIKGISEQAVIGVMGDLKDQADELLNHNLKDVSAIYGRIMLEDAIRRIAIDNGITTIGNKPLNKNQISRVNDELKKQDILKQHQWKQNEAWLTIGNKAAHGKFNEYDAKDVKTMLDGVKIFIDDNIS